MNIPIKCVSTSSISIKSGAKTKNRGSQGETLAKRGIETTAVAQKSTTKFRDIACKAIFSLLIWDRYNLCCNIPHCASTGNNRNIQAKNCFCMKFCTRRWPMSERLWQIALADHCMNEPLKNLRWSYWRLVWRQNCFNMYHWALGRSEKFRFEQFEN